MYLNQINLGLRPNLSRSGVNGNWGCLWQCPEPCSSLWWALPWSQPSLGCWTGLGRGQGGGRAGDHLGQAESCPTERNICVELRCVAMQGKDTYCWLQVVWQGWKTSQCRREEAGLCPAGTDRAGRWPRAFVTYKLSHQPCPALAAPPRFRGAFGCQAISILVPGSGPVSGEQPALLASVLAQSPEDLEQGCLQRLPWDVDGSGQGPGVA